MAGQLTGAMWVKPGGAPGMAEIAVSERRGKVLMTFVTWAEDGERSADMALSAEQGRVLLALLCDAIEGAEDNGR